MGLHIALRQNIFACAPNQQVICTYYIGTKPWNLFGKLPGAISVEHVSEWWIAIDPFLTMKMDWIGSFLSFSFHCTVVFVGFAYDLELFTSKMLVLARQFIIRMTYNHYFGRVFFSHLLLTLFRLVAVNEGRNNFYVM